MLRGGGDVAAGDHHYLWEKAAELERQFEGYKRRLRLGLAERTRAVVAVADQTPEVAVVDDDGAGAGAGAVVEEEEVMGRGRRYEAYVRRRDEKLRQGWRARMERKEAEMQALWARLDRGRRPDGDVAGSGLAAAATPAREQKPRSVEKPVLPATPRCSPAMKLPRLRSCMPSSSSAAAVSPRPSNRRASHREQQPPPAAPPQAADQPLPPATPRKENRMPPSAPTTPRPPKTLSRTRSSLRDGKEERERERGVRESPRPPPSRFQPPRPGYSGGGAGGSNPKEAAPAPPSSTTADADAVAVAAARSCFFHEQVVLAEIKSAAAAFVPEPFHLRRPGNNGATLASPPLVIPRDNIGRNNVEASEYHGGDEIARSCGKPGGAEITGDSDTEPSYVFVKKDKQDHQGSPATTIVKESPVTDAEEASRESSESLYSNVQSSFSQGSDDLDLDLDGASAAGSPLRSLPPSSRAAPSTEELLEADAAMLRKKREEEDGTAAEEAVLIPGTARSRVEPVAVQVQPPMDDAVAGLRRLMTFGKKNSKGADQEDGVSQGWPSGYSIKPRLGYADAASDDLDNGAYVISPHALLGAVRSLQSFVPSSPAKSELKERALPAKSPRVHRSFFSFSPFKNRGN